MGSHTIFGCIFRGPEDLLPAMLEFREEGKCPH